MAPRAATYNERSWAIDLIGHLKHLAYQSNCSIKDAGGEQTIHSEGRSLFPDVLLFGDRVTARILQGWELKMPDTGIDDFDFRSNAEDKARALGLDSFMLWNVSHAHLYVRDQLRNEYVFSRGWSDLSDITTRAAVVSNRRRWEETATEIFAYLNHLFDTGELEGRQFVEAYRSGGITALIMENSGQVAEALTAAARRDSKLRAGMILWWAQSEAEYAGTQMEQVLAQAIISNWIGKILFGHILRERDQRAQSIAQIGDQTSPAQALAVFRKLSEDCNFWAIFSDSIGLVTVPEGAWRQLKQFSRLLADLRVGSVDQAQLSSVLETTVEVATRKLRGQYSTPAALANLLVHLCVRNIPMDRVLDPCCGSGTIARAALEQKLAARVLAEQAAMCVFAGDQDPQAVQITTFALAKPDLMHIPLRIYQRDAFDLDPNLSLDFRNPTNGVLFTESLGHFEAIVSNLPFVAQVGRKQYGNAISRITARMGDDGKRFTRRADVAAYLPFALHPLLGNEGRLGIIITNAWLGTGWGDDFYRLLGGYYDLKSVLTSGAGRWFENSEVITNILILEKKINPALPSGSIQYIVLKRPLDEMSDVETVQVAAAQIELGQAQNDLMTIRSLTVPNAIRFRQLGLGGNAQFVNCDWVLDLPLAPLSNLFMIRRGERRGLNALFYPNRNHRIEPDYIRPLAKSPSDFTMLVGPATKVAFSCSQSEAELTRLGHSGALKWIKKFRTRENISKLTSAGRFWYEMRADNLTDLVMFINYGERLFVARVNPPAFVDQRFVRLIPQGEVDVELCHALMNCTISMFVIEGMGFGRGLGALDLNKDRIAEFMHILDPQRLAPDAIYNIKTAFSPLLQREIMGVADELEQADRNAFDDVVLAAFGITLDKQIIYDALLALVAIRLTAIN